MGIERTIGTRNLCLRAAAKRLKIPERTLRYRAGRGQIHGAFKQGKLWKFPATALDEALSRRPEADRYRGEDL